MGQGVISMSKLGQMGRFANQLVQYMFLRTYARQHDLEVQTPRWIGQQLFGLNDPPIVRQWPEFLEVHDKDEAQMVIPHLTEPLRNVDVAGFFQYPTRYYVPQQRFIQQLFTPIPSIQKPLDAAVSRLRQGSRTLVGLHVRRGDYGFSYFYRTPLDWYKRWLERMWPEWHDPVLFLATDEPRPVLRALKRYRPVTASDLGLRLPIAPYYPDFFLLSHADVLAIPNSTFSFVAALLNENLSAAYRSHLSDPLEDPPFRRFDPWNAEFLERGATVEQFPHIPGIAKPPPHRLRRANEYLRGIIRQWKRTLGLRSRDKAAA